MWLLSPALFLLSLPGCFSIQCPESVRGWEQGSLTMQCGYGPGWMTHRKYWCRGARWLSCQVLIETTGSQKEVKKPRISIRDNWENHSITVTMQGLRQDDNGTYWCGIKKTGTDLGTSIRVMVVPRNMLSMSAAKNHEQVFFGSRIWLNSRHHYMLLVFVKVPILLVLVGVVLWLKEPRSVPEEQREEPVYSNLSYDLTTDTAP